MARIRTLLRRSNSALASSVLKLGEIEINRDTRRAYRAGQEIHLGPTEFRLLEFLMSTPGRVFSREQLLNAVWGNDIYVNERTVDVHVGRLRKTLDIGNGADAIRTVRGAGYAFNEGFAAGGT
jgi:two-component system phosphate regulon response regulator PhoB